MIKITKEQLLFLINAKQQWLDKLEKEALSIPSIVKQDLVKEIQELRKKV